MTLSAAARTLQGLPLGTRVVVRYRIDGGLTDALGYLSEMAETECSVQTRSGTVVIRLDLVQAAKEVPPPPPKRRSAREPG